VLWDPVVCSYGALALGAGVVGGPVPVPDEVLMTFLVPAMVVVVFAGGCVGSGSDWMEWCLGVMCAG
jgi:hypothetical protein